MARKRVTLIFFLFVASVASLIAIRQASRVERRVRSLLLEESRRPGMDSFDMFSRSSDTIDQEYHDLGEEGFLAILRAAEDPDPVIARLAIRQLGRRADARAIPLLSRQYKSTPISEPQRLVRVFAFMSICKIVNEDADKLIINALADKDSEVRALAAEAAGKRRLYEAISNLRQLLTDASAAVRAHATSSLGSLNDLESASAIKSLLHDDYEWVRTQAGVALARLGDKSGKLEVLKSFRPLGGPTDANRVELVALLASFDDPECWLALENAAKSDGSSNVKIAALEAIKNRTRAREERKEK